MVGVLVREDERPHIALVESQLVHAVEDLAACKTVVDHDEPLAGAGRADARFWRLRSACVARLGMRLWSGSCLVQSVQYKADEMSVPHAVPHAWK